MKLSLLGVTLFCDWYFDWKVVWVLGKHFVHSLKNVSERVSISNIFRQTIYHGQLHWHHAGNLVSNNLPHRWKSIMSIILSVLAEFKFLFSSLFIVALMFGNPFRKMCPQHPLPTDEWSCDMELIIRIWRKLTNRYEAFHQRKSRNIFRYSNYDTYLF